MGGDKKPTAPQWIISPVRYVVQDLFRHIGAGMRAREVCAGEKKTIKYLQKEMQENLQDENC
jgi:hypothetical protein